VAGWTNSSEFRAEGIEENVGVDAISALEAGLGGRGGIAGLGEELRVALALAPDDPESEENTLLMLGRGLWKSLGGVDALSHTLNTS